MIVMMMMMMMMIMIMMIIIRQFVVKIGCFLFAKFYLNFSRLR